MQRRGQGSRSSFAASAVRLDQDCILAKMEYGTPMPNGPALQQGKRRSRCRQ